MNVILAIDPGNKQSGYVVVEHDGNEIVKVLDKGKINNEDIFPLFQSYKNYELAIEMIASYGMPVGKEIFDTCVWSGRFYETALCSGNMQNFQWIYRKDEKMILCGSMKAKDSNIIQALVDRYAPGQPNHGKGTKKAPGFFYGFAKDTWQAMAVATSYFEKYIKEVRL